MSKPNKSTGRKNQYTKYKAQGQSEKNRKARHARHLKAHPNDEQAKTQKIVAWRRKDSGKLGGWNKARDKESIMFGLKPKDARIMAQFLGEIRRSTFNVANLAPMANLKEMLKETK